MVRKVVILAALAALTSCGDSHPAGDGAVPDVAIDAGPTRPYALASAGAQLYLLQQPQPAIVLTAANLATDVDVVTIHQEFYGVPWNELEANAALPTPWVTVMDTLAAQAAAIGPTALSLQLVSGEGRRFLADRTFVSGGEVVTQSGWSADCYDFTSASDRVSKRAAYLAYVDWMVRKFRPRYVNVAIEINMFSVCPTSAWNGLVEVERAAYDVAKAAAPSAIVYPSIALEYLYGYANCPGALSDCYDAAYAQLAGLKRDRFAVTSLPYLVPSLRDPAAIPADWLTRAGDRGGERTIVAETGWLATSLDVVSGTQCVTGIASSEALQLAWFDKVMASADRIELVTWIANRDVMPSSLVDECPCTFDGLWCGFVASLRQKAAMNGMDPASAEYGLKVFGAMGLRRYDGTPRPGFLAHWQTARALPWRDR